MDNNRELWEKCAAFHGHECGGLTIGYKAVLYAMELLNLHSSDEIYCICEKDFCGVDAVRCLLDCNEANGKLHFNLTGEMAFTFKNINNIIRLVLKPGPDDMSKEESFAYYQSQEPKNLFTAEKIC